MDIAANKFLTMKSISEDLDILKSNIEELINKLRDIYNEQPYDYQYKIFKGLRTISLKIHRIGNLCHLLNHAISDMISNTDVSNIQSSDIAEEVPKLYGLRNRIHHNGFVPFNLVTDYDCPITVGVYVKSIKKNGGWSSDPRGYDFYYGGLNENSFIIIEKIINKIDEIILPIIDNCINQLDEKYGKYELKQNLKERRAI